jgi:dTDP-4-amino-4,6-dideoxygalactose transaminase
MIQRIGIVAPSSTEESRFIEAMKVEDIHCVFHYVPLHSAPAGLRVGRAVDGLPVTTDLAERLVRLPLWLGLEEEQERVIDSVYAGLRR